jgi:hypothetical protein
LPNVVKKGSLIIIPLFPYSLSGVSTTCYLLPFSFIAHYHHLFLFSYHPLHCLSIFSLVDLASKMLANVSQNIILFQITVTLDEMKCVIVRSSTSGVVKRVEGDCEGPEVTLTLNSSEHFVLDVYGE